jgi:hypothetical protein
MINIEKYSEFYEREHGYVFNFKQLEQLIQDVRNQTIDECANICCDLADLSTTPPTGDEFKHVYVFAMDRILDLKQIDKA